MATQGPKHGAQGQRTKLFNATCERCKPNYKWISKSKTEPCPVCGSVHRVNYAQIFYERSPTPQELIKKSAKEKRQEQAAAKLLKCAFVGSEVHPLVCALCGRLVNEHQEI